MQDYLKGIPPAHDIETEAIRWYWYEFCKWRIRSYEPAQYDAALKRIAKWVGV